MTLPIRSVVVVLCAAVVLSTASATTYGLFADTEQASGTVQAADTFHGGNNWSCGSEWTTGGSAAPSVDNLTVTVVGNQNRKFDIDATLSDPNGDLRRVSIKVNRTKNSNADFENTTTVSGASASISDRTGTLGNKKTYCVRVTVSDGADNAESIVKREATG